jgi:hypothetical protein
VLKDTVILAGGWLLVVDGARAILAQMAGHPEAQRADGNHFVAPAGSRYAADTAAQLSERRTSRLETPERTLSRH